MGTPSFFILYCLSCHVLKHTKSLPSPERFHMRLDEIRYRSNICIVVATYEGGKLRSQSMLTVLNSLQELNLKLLPVPCFVRSLHRKGYRVGRIF